MEELAKELAYRNGNKVTYTYGTTSIHALAMGYLLTVSR